LGLDGEALDACVKSGRYRKSVEADAAAAQKAGARGTPTFFVNGKRLDGWQTYNQLAGAVDAALESLAASPSGSK
jgi:predicted DsbA family dithiol-disulfide isomerase